MPEKLFWRTLKCVEFLCYPPNPHHLYQSSPLKNAGLKEEPHLLSHVGGYSAGKGVLWFDDPHCSIQRRLSSKPSGVAVKTHTHTHTPCTHPSFAWWCTVVQYIDRYQSHIQRFATKKAKNNTKNKYLFCADFDFFSITHAAASCVYP